MLASALSTGFTLSGHLAQHTTLAEQLGRQQIRYLLLLMTGAHDLNISSLSRIRRACRTSRCERKCRTSKLGIVQLNRARAETSGCSSRRGRTSFNLECTSSLDKAQSSTMPQATCLHEIVKVILRSILVTRLGNSIFSMQIIISMIALPSQLFTLLGHPRFFLLLHHEAARLVRGPSKREQKMSQACFGDLTFLRCTSVSCLRMLRR